MIIRLQVTNQSDCSLVNLIIITASFSLRSLSNYPMISPSFMTDKIRELSANGIIVVSAVGNDGPLWGNLNLILLYT